MNGLNELIWSRIFAEFGCYDNNNDVFIEVNDEGNTIFKTNRGQVQLHKNQCLSYIEAEAEVRRQLGDIDSEGN